MNDFVNKTESLPNAENLVNEVQPKVAVVSRHESLLGCAIENLVGGYREWTFLQSSEDQNVKDLVQKVKEANPDIVIVPQNELAYDGQLLMRLSQDFPELKKVIFVSLSENLLEVYSKQTLQINSVQDLFSEVENQFSTLQGEKSC